MITLLAAIFSCSKYLDEKPNKKLTTPSSFRDLQLMLDNETVFNADYPACGEVASDNYYLLDADYLNLAVLQRDNYIWDGSFEIPSYWESPYQKVFYANVILDHIDKFKEDNSFVYNSIKGSALFFRAFAFFKLAQIFAPPIDVSRADFQLGLSIITSSDVNTENRRSSLGGTYKRVLDDLHEAALLLPVSTAVPTRPNKAAAYTLLSYTYLILQNFEKANEFADSSLSLKSELMDFNQLTNSDNPFPRFNKEVLFQARLIGAPSLAQSRCRVDSNLYRSYESDDLRKVFYFKQNSNGTIAFKGSYDGNPTGSNLFCGISVDETYLIKAESLARLGRTDESMYWLNKLLVNRWKIDVFSGLGAATAEEAVSLILEERRKELAFRGGTRWTDIRRLNLEPNRAITLRRVVNGDEYVLPPNDSRYTFLIPNRIVQLSGIEQNPR